MSQEKHAPSKDMARPLLGSAARSDQSRRTAAVPSGLSAARGMAAYLHDDDGERVKATLHVNAKAESRPIVVVRSLHMM